MNMWREEEDCDGTNMDATHTSRYDGYNNMNISGGSSSNEGFMDMWNHVQKPNHVQEVKSSKEGMYATHTSRYDGYNNMNISGGSSSNEGFMDMWCASISFQNVRETMIDHWSRILKFSKVKSSKEGMDTTHTSRYDGYNNMNISGGSSSNEGFMDMWCASTKEVLQGIYT